ncbi:hypothetical protein [Streptomyces sp. NPDC091215]|uniref:hypothetical protein n=1 Tax=Streptomyces sp. NPDC091215 TaxID=3155192 RepID=UPI0034361301
MTAYPEIAARFARETASHEMTVLHDDGLYRHLRFKPKEHSFYWFDLITTPGQLVFSGDGDSFVFRRLTDMFEFFRSGLMRDGSIEINPVYWSEKLVSERDNVQKYQEDLFIKLVWEQANHLIEQEHVKPEQADRFRQAIKDDIVEGGLCGTADEAYRTVEEFEFYNDPSKEFDYRFQPDVRFEDAWEWFNATKDFDWWFLWVCRAIVWGIARYDRVRGYGLATLAAPKLETPAKASDLTVYRASHGSIVMGHYTSRQAAMDHVHGVLANEEGGDVTARVIWRADDPEVDEPEWECWLFDDDMSDDSPTGYVVTPLEVASAYDPDADE